jgi:hypothetical protein
MSLRTLSLPLLVSLFVLLGGCSGGSSGSSSSTPSCADPSDKFCLVSCNLGCSVSGSCLVTEIAQNQPIVLNFSLPIDPATVTNTSVSLKTANGESPTGRFVVDGSSLVFQPEARLVGGNTVFGFRPQETYLLSLLAGSNAALRATSGELLATPVVCSLSVTRGLIDLDGQPPTAELLVPTATSEVDPRSPIVVRFSELINTSNFGINTEVSPIRYTLARSSTDPVSGALICPGGADAKEGPILIQGVPVASVEINGDVPQTVVTLQPAVSLPSGGCVYVWIQAGAVRDLAGTPSVESVFRFTLAAGSSEPQTVTETFASDQRLDRVASGGSWVGGVATPANLGGRGVHGSFNPSDGAVDGTGAFVWNTDLQLIPAERALFGSSRPEFLQVVDGQFEFTDFIVPSGVRVRFRGSKPAVIRVRGQVRIDGELLLDGGVPSTTFDPAATLGGGFPPTYLAVDGQNPAPGGAGGGDGGRGARGCSGTQALPENSGQRGEDLVVPAGSGYAGMVAGTGGRGGPLFPASGLFQDVTLNLFGSICGQLAGGGGGGNFLGGAAPGRAIATFSPAPGNVTDLGPNGPVGNSLPAVVLPPSGVSSLEHFLVGGAGGGGGGSQPLNMTTQQIGSEMRPWHAGAAGCGGGGAIALRAGHSVTLSGSGRISARGGGGITFNGTSPNPANPPSPGGAGSGGSILIQVENVALLSQGGVLDVRGGAENRLIKSQFLPPPAESSGGAGGRGFARIEADNISANQVGTIEPSASAQGDHFGPMDDTDDFSGFVSLWRPTRQVFEPGYISYRLTAVIQGQQVVFSDSTAPGEFNPANRDDLPLRIYLQGGSVNASSELLEGEPTVWVDFVNPNAGGLSISTANDADGQPVDATGFRFMILFNRTVETDIVIEEFTVTFQP